MKENGWEFFLAACSHIKELIYLLLGRKVVTGVAYIVAKNKTYWKD